MVNKCGTTLHVNSMFHNSAFIRTGLWSGLFGAYFGINLDAAYYKGTSPNIHRTSLFVSIVRGVVLGLCVAPLYFDYYGFKSTSSLMVLYIFKTTVPAFLTGFFVFGFFKIVARMLHLTKED